MTVLFDRYDRSYGATVQSSIDFTGLPHSFFMTAKAELLRELLATHLPAGNKPAALDIGCGIGAFHPYVRGMFSRLDGTDVSAASLAQARRDNPDVAYTGYEGEHLPYDSAAFDLAFAICVMHHVSRENWLGFVGEMRRVVRPGGVVCIIEHNPFNPLTRLAVARCAFDRDAVLLSAGRLRRLAAESGLYNVEARYFLLLPWAASWTRRLEHTLRHAPLGAQYAAWGTV